MQKTTRTDIEWTAFFQGEPLTLTFSSLEEVEDYIERGVAVGNDRDDYEVRSREVTRTATEWIPDADTMLAENAASKKNGGVALWSDEDLVRAFEREGATTSDAQAAVEAAKLPPAGAWLSEGQRVRTAEEQAALDRVELRNELREEDPWAGGELAARIRRAQDRLVEPTGHEPGECEDADCYAHSGDEELGEAVPDYSPEAIREQAKRDELELERRGEDRPFVAAWRRRELERLERGETAGKDLGLAEDPPLLFVDIASLSREELEQEIRKVEAREYRTGGTADGTRVLDALRDELDSRGYRDDDYADGYRLGHGDEDGLLAEDRSETYYRGYEAGAEARAKDAIEQARDAAQSAREERAALAEEARFEEAAE